MGPDQDPRDVKRVTGAYLITCSSVINQLFNLGRCVPSTAAAQRPARTGTPDAGRRTASHAQCALACGPGATRTWPCT
eukprot:3483388-Prymnesium_polylepis.1